MMIRMAKQFRNLAIVALISIWCAACEKAPPLPTEDSPDAPIDEMTDDVELPPP